MARSAGTLWSVGFGLHALPTLVRDRTVRPPARGCRAGRERGTALYRLFAHQAAPGWVESPRRTGGTGHRPNKGGTKPKLAAIVKRGGRAVALGLAEVYAAAILGTQWKSVTIFIVLVLVLLFKPSGLFGEAVTQTRA